MNAREQIVLSYADLSDGVSLAGERCPACGGGSTEERTLSVSKREGTLLWKCHRASCEFAGAATVGGRQDRTLAVQVPQVRGTVGRFIAEQSEALDEHVAAELLARYGITKAHIAKYGIGWDKETERLAIPVTDFRSERLGVVLRALDKRQPKSKSHTEQGAMSWFVNHTATIPGIIIVEDQFSAIRASDYLTSVALLGTHLSEENVDALRAARLRPVYLALDADAWEQSVRLAIQHRARLPLQLVRLSKDIKDMSDTELKELVDAFGISS